MVYVKPPTQSTYTPPYQRIPSAPLDSPTPTQTIRQASRIKFPLTTGAADYPLTPNTPTTSQPTTTTPVQNPTSGFKFSLGGAFLGAGLQLALDYLFPPPTGDPELDPKRLPQKFIFPPPETPESKGSIPFKGGQNPNAFYGITVKHKIIPTDFQQNYDPVSTGELQPFRGPIRSIVVDNETATKGRLTINSADGITTIPLTQAGFGFKQIVVSISVRNLSGNGNDGNPPSVGGNDYGVGNNTYPRTINNNPQNTPNTNDLPPITPPSVQNGLGEGLANGNSDGVPPTLENPTPPIQPTNNGSPSIGQNNTGNNSGTREINQQVPSNKIGLPVGLKFDNGTKPTIITNLQVKNNSPTDVVPSPPITPSTAQIATNTDISKQIEKLKLELGEKLKGLETKVGTQTINNITNITNNNDGGMNCEELKDCLATNTETANIKKFKGCNKDTGEAEFENVNITVNKGDKDHVEAIAETLANLEAEQCDKSDAIALVPDWWQIRTGQRPQLVVRFQIVNNDGTIGESAWSLAVPHYVRGENFKPKFPNYKRGDIQGILVLEDNSKVIVNCVNITEAKRVIAAIKQYIDPNFLKNSYEKYAERKGNPFAQVNVRPISAKFFPDGQKNTTPAWSISLR